MMKAQHTPGPWVTDKATIRTQAEPGWLIATIENAIARDANARLIASAPDLLAALENLLQSDLVEWFPPSPNTGGKGDWTDELKAKGAPILAARAAIAKAKGMEE